MRFVFARNSGESSSAIGARIDFFELQAEIKIAENTIHNEKNIPTAMRILFLVTRRLRVFCSGCIRSISWRPR